MRLEVLLLETFILVLIEGGTESHGKNSISWKILITSIIAQVIMTAVLINMVLNAEHCYDFRKIKVRLMKEILMLSFCGTLDTD